VDDNLNQNDNDVLLQVSKNKDLSRNLKNHLDILLEVGYSDSNIIDIKSLRCLV